MLENNFAEHFAADWIDSWNSHDLERILSHYTDDFEMASPVIIKVAGEPSGIHQFRVTSCSSKACAAGSVDNSIS